MKYLLQYFEVFWSDNIESFQRKHLKYPEYKMDNVRKGWQKVPLLELILLLRELQNLELKRSTLQIRISGLKKKHEKELEQIRIQAAEELKIQQEDLKDNFLK